MPNPKKNPIPQLATHTNVQIHCKTPVHAVKTLQINNLHNIHELS